MNLDGHHLIGKLRSRQGGDAFHALDPKSGETLPPAYPDATHDEIDRAVRLADEAAGAYADLPTAARAAFLRSIGEAITALGDALLERAGAETALPPVRLAGERGRTVFQLDMFADLVADGSWVDARVDRPQPDRQPIPKPDVRRMLMPLGPVAVFGASNFPLAFSVAGGDTASALAAGCPVVVKAHPAHPGTSELVAGAIAEAVRQHDLPEGVFSLLHGIGHDVGATLVEHPLIRAVGFTGSLAGGRALFDAAARRSDPIPVYAEMGSANPVFILPGALHERGDSIAEGLASSVTLGAGQFCTNPGLAVLPPDAAADVFLERAGELLAATPACTVVHPGIKLGYETALDEVTAIRGVDLARRSEAAGPHPETDVQAALLITDAATWTAHPRLGHEVYGPATIAVRCATADDLTAFARSLHGHLTATVHATEDDLETHGELIRVLRRKVGRLVLNGFPTGVEVCAAMHHGGPYPATTDERSTSVGTAAIERFARPICYQDFPQSALPDALRDDNPLGLRRLVDGRPEA